MNVYYDPEKFGLKVIGELEKGASYEFDTFVVWQKENGDLVYGTDSGCSCPTPFEDQGLNDLKPYSEQALDEWVAEDNWRELKPTEMVQFKEKIRAFIEQTMRRM